MPLPKSAAAYTDCLERFEEILSSARGMRFDVGGSAAASRLRLRMNTYRALLRRQAEAVYPEGDPRRGVTPYDGILLTIDAEGWLVCAKPTAFGERKEAL